MTDLGAGAIGINNELARRDFEWVPGLAIEDLFQP